jgi:hypothetical protein
MVARLSDSAGPPSRALLCSSCRPKPPSCLEITQDMHHFRSVSMYLSAFVHLTSCTQQLLRSGPGSQMPDPCHLLCLNSVRPILRRLKFAAGDSRTETSNMMPEARRTHPSCSVPSPDLHHGRRLQSKARQAWWQHQEAFCAGTQCLATVAWQGRAHTLVNMYLMDWPPTLSASIA